MIITTGKDGTLSFYKDLLITSTASQIYLWDSLEVCMMHVYSPTQACTIKDSAEHFFPKSSLQLERDNNIPVVVLGDSAYPLMRWLLKPFPHGATSQDQQRFNYHLSQAGMVTENAFARLKGRWRCLMKRLDVELHKVPTVVAYVNTHQL